MIPACLKVLINYGKDGSFISVYKNGVMANKAPFL